MDTTGMFTSDARCILAASITSMTSILLMRANSIFMVSLPAVEMTLGKCWAHSSNTLISFFRLRIRRFLYGRVQINVWGSALALTTDRFCLHVLQRERFQSMFLGSSHRLTAPGWKYCLYSFRKGRGNLTGWGNLSDWAYGHSAEKGVLLCIYFMFPPYQFCSSRLFCLMWAAFMPARRKRQQRKRLRNVGWKAATASNFSSFKSLYSHPRPINPACSPLKSAPRK